MDIMEGWKLNKKIIAKKRDGYQGWYYKHDN